MEANLQVHEVIRTNPFKLFALLSIFFVDFLKVILNVAFGLLELIIVIGLTDEYSDAMDAENK